MEVWQDYQTGTFFNIDNKSGRQSPSSRFGVEKAKFIAYSSGFSRATNKSQPKLDKMYSVQPEKFDGYCQYPRPLEKCSSNRVPFIKSNIVSRRIFIKDKEKIPTPLKFLDLSQKKTPSPGLSSKSIQSLSVKYFRTISDTKKQNSKQPLKEIKTVTDLTLKIKAEKLNNSVHSKPQPNEPRRRLKGFFSKQYKTSEELMKEERRVIKLTNPDFFEKLKKDKERDDRILRRIINSSRRQKN